MDINRKVNDSYVAKLNPDHSPYKPEKRIPKYPNISIEGKITWGAQVSAQVNNEGLDMNLGAFKVVGATYGKSKGLETDYFNKNEQVEFNQSVGAGPFNLERSQRLYTDGRGEAESKYQFGVAYGVGRLPIFKGSSSALRGNFNTLSGGMNYENDSNKSDVIKFDFGIKAAVGLGIELKVSVTP